MRQDEPTRRPRAALTALALALAATAVTAPTAAADPATPTAAADPATAAVRTDTCTGEFKGDARLGPEQLPHSAEPPVGPLLRGYHRTGGLSTRDFLATYWKEEGPGGAGGWKYPPNDGFAEADGQVDKHVETLEPGAELDRFGSEYGSYLAPAGAPYARRALPPQNLNTREAAYPCDYHRYTVTREFNVWQGRAMPWFEQPGGGLQIKLDPALLMPGADERLDVGWLVDHGYLAPARDSAP